MCPLYANGHRNMITIALVWSGRVVSFLNSTTRTRRLCLRLDQTHGQNPYMSRLNEQVYDQTKSADLSETRANPTGLCRRPGRRPGSPTKSGRVALVEFGLNLALSVQTADMIMTHSFKLILTCQELYAELLCIQYVHRCSQDFCCRVQL